MIKSKLRQQIAAKVSGIKYQGSQQVGPNSYARVEDRDFYKQELNALYLTICNLEGEKPHEQYEHMSVEELRDQIRVQMGMTGNQTVLGFHDEVEVGTDGIALRRVELDILEKSLP